MVDKNLPILVVDDFMTMRTIIEGILKQLGFSNIDTATNGEQALEKIRGKSYGLILSDWNMEPMSGLDLLKNVRGGVNTKNIPLILITAESKPDNIIAAKKAGVSNYIVKPFNANTLKDKLVSVLGEF